MLDTEGTKPIYIQIAEWLENEILNGNFNIGDKIHSQYTLADIFNINPATAAKGLNMLHDEQIVYNKRGLGKFVAPDARIRIVEKRKNQTLKSLIRDIVLEAERLDVDEDELFEMIGQIIREEKGEDT